MRSGAAGIAGWVKNSFIDYPGTVSTVLFFSGCNLRCPYCHNPGIVQNASPRDIPFRDILDFLVKRKNLIEGVVLSGGEPTIHEALETIVQEIRSLEYKIKLDTNGMLPEKIKKIAPDYLALDIKTTPANYPPLLKAPYKNVRKRLLESIAIVKAMGENAEMRITIAPKIIDSKIIEAIGEMIAGVKKVFLQPMQTRVEILDPAFKDMEKIPEEEIERYRETLCKLVESCEIRLK
jgi:pyruvate formate lyase activating enzyme